MFFWWTGGGSSQDGLGTHKILTTDAAYAMWDSMFGDPAIAHANVYRGKNLGSEITEEQIAHIHDGSFKDLYVGDYWEGSDGVKYAIADINYFKDKQNITNDNPILGNHLVVVPYDLNDNWLCKWDTGQYADTTKGYLNSYIRTIGLDKIRPYIEEVFGNNLVPHSRFLYNSFIMDTDNISVKSVNGSWVTTDLELLSAFMVLDPINIYNSDRVYHTTQVNAKLKLFDLNPDSIILKPYAHRYWVDTIASYGRVVYIQKLSVAPNEKTNVTMCIRPYFCIG